MLQDANARVNDSPPTTIWMKLFLRLVISPLLASVQARSGSASDASSIAAVDDGHVAAARPPIDVAVCRVTYISIYM